MSGKDNNPQSYLFNPIGYCYSPLKFKNAAPRQANLLPVEGEEHFIELLANQNFEQALEGLEGCDRIWVVFVFHHNQNWKPKVLPPRGPSKKVGVFASRSPYRPNPIGISSVRVLKISGRRIYIGESDLLDGTPVLDIKPYIAYSDSFAEAKYPWVDEQELNPWEISYSERAQAKINFLKSLGLDLTPPIIAQLKSSPLDKSRTRLVPSPSASYCFAYRTWRIDFEADLDRRRIELVDIRSGYQAKDLSEKEDPYQDKYLHSKFLEWSEKLGPSKN